MAQPRRIRARPQCLAVPLSGIRTGIIMIMTRDSDTGVAEPLTRIKPLAQAHTVTRSVRTLFRVFSFEDSDSDSADPGPGPQMTWPQAAAGADKQVQGEPEWRHRLGGWPPRHRDHLESWAMLSMSL